MLQLRRTGNTGPNLINGAADPDPARACRPLTPKLEPGLATEPWWRWGPRIVSIPEGNAPHRSR